MLPSKTTLIFLLLTAAGVVRIAATYRAVGQTSDETPNIACGMQYLDLGRYTYGAFHPPLARIAVAIGPYLYGARSQKLADRWQEGNAVLNSARRYGKTLTLARMGILPFFILACTCVWLWGRRLLGEWGALAPVFLFTNIPPVLAHAGVATADMAVGAGICAALYTFTRWLDHPDWKRSVLFGAGLAAAFLAKFSSILLLPVCIAAILVLRRIFRLPAPRGRNWAWAPVAFLLIWGAYRFSFGVMTEHVAWLPFLERVPVPAPQILDGLWQVHSHIEGGHAAYLLGRNSLHGWWYFFPVALAVKTPLGLLVLAAIGWLALFRTRLRTKLQPFDWHAWCEQWTPAVLSAVMLLVNLPTSLNIGVRYMLPLFPMLALTAGMGVMFLLRRPEPWLRGWAIVLMLWVAVSSVAAHPDYLAYFNELGGSHPERILVDSDLDWGQDMNRLVAELRRRHVDRLHMACLYTGDDSRLDLPSWDTLEAYQPVTGWVAVSFTMLKTYGWLAAQQRGRPDSAFAWLDRYQPVARVGKSILLYYIPDDHASRLERQSL